MWVRRVAAFIKPGLMAEAVAYMKALPPQDGISVRLLRPVSGEEANHQLIVELSFEDADAGLAWLADIQPPRAPSRWTEISQNRAMHEFYQVWHDVPCQGPPGLWVDRRIRFCPRDRRGDAIDLWRIYRGLGIPGFSLRLLSPRAGDERAQPLVVEQTAMSIAELQAGIHAHNSTPDGGALIRKIQTCEESFPIIELLRVVE